MEPLCLRLLSCLRGSLLCTIYYGSLENTPKGIAPIRASSLRAMPSSSRLVSGLYMILRVLGSLEGRSGRVTGQRRATVSGQSGKGSPAQSGEVGTPCLWQPSFDSLMAEEHPTDPSFGFLLRRSRKPPLRLQAGCRNHCQLGRNCWLERDLTAREQRGRAIERN